MYDSAQKSARRSTTIRHRRVVWKGGLNSMNLDRLQGSWQQLSGKFQEHWGSLTDDPHAVAAGRRDRLAGRVLEQRGISKQQAERQLQEFLIRHRNWWDLSGR